MTASFMRGVKLDSVTWNSGINGSALTNSLFNIWKCMFIGSSVNVIHICDLESREPRLYKLPKAVLICLT